MRKFLIGLMAVAAALLVVPASAGATGGGGTAKVYVVHGLPLPPEVTGPGTPVDVFVNGSLAIDDFKFGQQVGPLPLPQGSYVVDVKTPDGKTRLFGRTVAVPASGNFSLVASFVDAAGTLGINVFSNDVKRAKFGEGKLALHHAAAAPAVDIDGGIFPLSRIFPHLKKELAADVVNGQAATFALPTWLRYTVDVRVANTKTVVLPVDNVKVSRNVLTNVYVVGSVAGGTLQALVPTPIPVG